MFFFFSNYRLEDNLSSQSFLQNYLNKQYNFILFPYLVCLKGIYPNTREKKSVQCRYISLYEVNTGTIVFPLLKATNKINNSSNFLDTKPGIRRHGIIIVIIPPIVTLKSANGFRRSGFHTLVEISLQVSFSLLFSVY